MLLAYNQRTTRGATRSDQYHETADGIKEAFPHVPCKVVDSSTSDLETFDEICKFAEAVAAEKAEKLGPEGIRALKEMVGFVSCKEGI